MAIRSAAERDAGQIAALYGHHVMTGTATFDTEPPSAEIWQSKLSEILAHGWPFLIAEREDAVVGYAYATQFRDRAAYAHTCETSIYVRAGAIGTGIGSALMAALIDAARARDFREMIAVIGGGEPGSVALHAKFGFRQAGRMERVGLKFGRLLDTVDMQRGLGDAETD